MSTPNENTDFILVSRHGKVFACPLSEAINLRDDDEILIGRNNDTMRSSIADYYVRGRIGRRIDGSSIDRKTWGGKTHREDLIVVGRGSTSYACLHNDIEQLIAPFCPTCRADWDILKEDQSWLNANSHLFRRCVDLFRAWQYTTNIRSIPADIKFENVVSLSGAFDYSNVEIVPSTIDLSNCLNMKQAFRYCRNLKVWNILDMRSSTTFYRTWQGCDLSKWPSTNVSSGEDFLETWQHCKFVSFPGDIDFSSAKRLRGTWANEKSLKSFPGTLDFSNVEDMARTFSEDTKLATFPDGLDVSNCTNFTNCWSNTGIDRRGADNIIKTLVRAAKKNPNLANIEVGMPKTRPSRARDADMQFLRSRGYTFTFSVYP